MAQFLRPDSTVSQTNWTSGGYAQIDESSASDADYARSQAFDTSKACTFEVTLSNPSGTPGTGTTTVRFRAAKMDNVGTLSSTGTTVTCQCLVKQGASTIAFSSEQILGGSWTTYSFTPNMSGVSNWNDLRLLFIITTDADTGARCGAVSWAELEAPNEVTDGAIAGSSSVTFTPTGAVGVRHAIAGSASATFSVVGDLAAGAIIEGAAAVSFSASATLVADAPIEGSATVAFSSAADLSTLVELSGAVTTSFSLSDSIRAFRRRFGGSRVRQSAGRRRVAAARRPKQIRLGNDYGS